MSLMALGAYLAIVGVADLLRAQRPVVGGGRLATILAVATALTVVFLVWTGDAPVGDVLLGAGMLAGVGTWVVGSSAALDPDRPGREAWRTVAVAGFAGGAAVSVLFVGALEDWVLWPDWFAATVFASWPPADVTVSAGAVLLQLATANFLVRLVLDAVGAPAGPEEWRLTGGRLLGPMERILIVVLGHIGQLLAATVLLAAKVLRFPVRRTARSGNGAGDGAGDAGAEHFLVGSFASWLIGLFGVALIYLA